MPDKVEVHDNIFESLVITFEQSASLDQREVKALLLALTTWKMITDLDEFKFMKTAPGVYEYEVKHKDARVWEGEADFNINPNDPTVLLERPDGWRLEETQRVDVSDALIDVVNKLALVSVEATYV